MEQIEQSLHSLSFNETPGNEEIKQRKLDTLNKAIRSAQSELDTLKQSINSKKNELDRLKQAVTSTQSELDAKTKKGSLSSKNGKQYEKQCWNILRFTSINDEPFNLQNVDELGGSSSKCDLICTNKSRKIGIEVKCNSTEFMQAKLNFNEDIKQWEPSNTGKNPEECAKIFASIVKDKNIFGNKIPIFDIKSFTNEEWLYHKKLNNYNDLYFDISDDTIQKLYSAKHCSYIQIKGCGLYHLGVDSLNFLVPYFDIGKQLLRVRVKTHKTTPLSLSITASCVPYDMKKNLKHSKYSLDDKDKLPSVLKYLSNDDNL